MAINTHAVQHQAKGKSAVLVSNGGRRKAQAAKSTQRKRVRFNEQTTICSANPNHIISAQDENDLWFSANELKLIKYQMLIDVRTVVTHKRSSKWQKAFERLYKEASSANAAQDVNYLDGKQFMRLRSTLAGIYAESEEFLGVEKYLLTFLVDDSIEAVRSAVELMSKQKKDSIPATTGKASATTTRLIRASGLVAREMGRAQYEALRPSTDFDNSSSNSSSVSSSGSQARKGNSLKLWNARRGKMAKPKVSLGRRNETI